MKRSLLLALVLLSSNSDALPLYNPAAASLLPCGVFCCTWADHYSMNIGFTGNYVRHHKLEVTGGAVNHDVREASIRTNACYVDFNLYNRFDIYANLGGSNFSYNIPRAALGIANAAKSTVATDTSFSWSLGGRGTLLSFGDLALGAEGEYFRSNPNIRAIRNGSPSNLNYTYSEWQVGLGAGYRINIVDASTAFIPYFGGRLGATRVRGGGGVFLDPDAQTNTLPNMEQQSIWGYSVGLTFLGGDKIQVTAEGAFLNETGFLINSSFRY